MQAEARYLRVILDNRKIKGEGAADKKAAPFFIIINLLTYTNSITPPPL